MKTSIAILAILVVFAHHARAQHKLTKLWETDSVLAIPESVLAAKDVLYVSLIDGKPWEMDGKGEIAKLDKNGKILNASWASGLNAPKGMAIWKGDLYVADVNAVAVIDLATGKIKNRIKVDGATGLNDVSVDSKGVVYVSDSQLGNVHKISGGIPTPYLTGLKGVNGVKADANDLYVLTSNDVFKVGEKKEMTSLGQTEVGGDGIEPIGGGDFVITCWPGIIYYLPKGGKLEVMLDTRPQKTSSADLGIDASQRVIYIPTFFKKSVVAYRVSK